MVPPKLGPTLFQLLFGDSDQLLKESHPIQAPALMELVPVEMEPSLGPHLW